MIVIPNEKLLAVAKDAGFFDSFRIADDILRQAVQGISDIITIPGIINRDFADVNAIMAGMGYAVMGTATAKRRPPHHRGRDGRNCVASARRRRNRRRAGILMNITGSRSLKLAEVNEASTIIQSAAHEDANIIFGAVLDEKMKDEVKITVIATGFKADQIRRRERTSVAVAVAQPHFEHAPAPIHYQPEVQTATALRAGACSASRTRSPSPSRRLKSPRKHR